MIQIAELINLLIDIICIPLVFLVFRNRNLPRYNLFLVAILLVVLGHAFTIVEGFFLKDFFNFLEHFSLLAAAVVFLIGALKYFIREERS